MDAPRRRTHWFVADVLAPFAASRALLLACAWYALQFAPSWNYFLHAAAIRGWTYLPFWPLDVWAKYDTVWYLDVAWNGYRLPDGPGWQSNLAFFPLFPALTRGAYALLPKGWHGFTALYLCGLAVANAAALGGLALVHAWVRARGGDSGLARRTVLLVLLFPAGFFLSCAYSESVFLLAAAGSLYALARRRPLLAGAMGALAALARPTGVLLAIPIAWEALSPFIMGRVRLDSTSSGRSARERLRPQKSAEVEVPGPSSPRFAWRPLLAALLPPLGLALHAANLWRISGEPLAFLRAQAAWGRGLSPPWTFLFSRPGVHPWTAPIDRGAILLFLALGVWLLLRERRIGEGAFVLLSLVPVMCSGTPMSATRLVCVLFPALVPLARLAGRERAAPAVYGAFAVVQALLFVAWSRFYWVA